MSVKRIFRLLIGLGAIFFATMILLMIWEIIDFAEDVFMKSFVSYLVIAITFWICTVVFKIDPPKPKKKTK